MHDTDLNTKLANWAKSCVGRAEKLEQQADRVLAARKSGGEFPGLVERYDREFVQKRTEAAKWRERAKVAEEGFMLADHFDSEFMLQNSALIGECARQHRCRYVQSAGHGGMERQGLTPEQK